MILIHGEVPGSFEICPGKVGNFLWSCREVKSAQSGNTDFNLNFDQFRFPYLHFFVLDYIIAPVKSSMKFCLGKKMFSSFNERLKL